MGILDDVFDSDMRTVFLDTDGFASLIIYTDENGKARQIAADVSTIVTVQVVLPQGGIEIQEHGTAAISKSPDIGVAVPSMAATLTINKIIYNVKQIDDDPTSAAIHFYRIRPQEVGLAQHR